VETLWAKCETVGDSECCPVCDYPTRGLQSPFRCPECGVQYDITTIVCRPGLRWNVVRFSFSGLLCTPALLYALLHHEMDAVVWLLVAGIMWFPLAWMRWRKTRMLLLLSERTLLVYRRHREPRVLSYEDITGVQLKKLTGDVCMITEDGREEIVVPYDFFSGSKSARRFIDLLRDRATSANAE